MEAMHLCHLCLSGPSRERAWRVQARPVIDTDPETLHQLTSHPCGYKGQYHRGQSHHESQRARNIVWLTQSQHPAEGKEPYNDHIANSVKEADLPGSRTCGYAEPIDETEDGSSKATHDACGDVPECYL